MKKTRIKQTLFEKLLNLITWTLGLLVIYWLILKLTNHSPTIEQVGIGVFGFIGVLVVRQQYKFGKIDEFKSNTERELSFIRNKVDKIDKIEVDINYMKSDIDYIKSRV